jgi:hypothetical protein
MADTINVCVYRHAEGVGLSLNDLRVAGPKPRGGAEVIHSFDVHMADLLLALRPDGESTAFDDTPKSPSQALQVLAAFARTAPGRLPERVEKALRLAEVSAFSHSGKATALGTKSIVVRIGDFESVAVDESGHPIRSTTVEAYELRSLRLRTRQDRLNVEHNGWLSGCARDEVPMVLLSRVDFERLVLFAEAPTGL